MLVAPSPALALHASNSVNALHAIAAELPAWAQLRALVYAVRWDIGIEPRELIGSVLEGDRWFVQASGAVRTFLSRVGLFLAGGEAHNSLS